MYRKWVLWVVIGLIVVLAVFLVSPGFGLLSRFIWAEKTGQVEAEVEVQSANFRLQAYHQFYDILVSIAEDEEMYDQQYEILQTLDTETKDYIRVQQNMSALVASIAKQKADYNAKAQQWTRGQFLDNDLPDRLELSTHKYGNRTGGL